MFSAAKSKGLEKAIASASSISLPSFLVPAFYVPSRSFSASAIRPSHLGKTPLSIPPEVNISIIKPPPTKNVRMNAIAKNVVNIDGPLGRMSMEVPNFVTIEQDQEARRATVSIEDAEVKQQREMWGTTWAYLQNHILGVSEGHTAILRLVGVGYRATVEENATTVASEFPGQKFVNLKVGYSHPIELPVPMGVNASTPHPTRLLLEGIEKEVVMSFAAKIRKWRVPEPYKGKGIFVNGETIKLKAKKVK